MKIGILGAGYAGLTAAYYLLKQDHSVTVFEKNEQPGGLAVGFKEKSWDYALEKHYHHFFTNDQDLINLAKEIGLSSELIFPASLTSLYIRGQIYPFNTPGDILNFKPLNFLNRLRLGLVTVLLKMLPEWSGLKLEQDTAFNFSQKWFGQGVFKLVWQPLLESKFGGYASQVNASWLWARIKKRTLRLGYVRGGFQILADQLAEKVEEKGGKIIYNAEISQINSLRSFFSSKTKQNKNRWVLSLREVPSSSRDDAAISSKSSRHSGEPEGRLQNPTKNDSGQARMTNFIDSRLRENDKEEKIARHDEEFSFDILVSTLPSPVFVKLFSNLPKDYLGKLNSIPHLHALNLVLETKEPFLKDTYWLNINEKNFPFLCVVQHTNFIDKKNYGGDHLLYISNYLPFGHPYFQKTPEELLKIYRPYLKKINPSFNFNIINRHSGKRVKRVHPESYRSRFWTSQNDAGNVINLKLFVGPYAQPVFLPNYSKIRPFGQILPHLYFANLDSVYPWDRGTNYAIELGRNIATLVSQK